MTTENKKSKSGIFLPIIMVVMGLVMAYLFYQNYEMKNAMDSSSSELEREIYRLKNRVEDLEDETYDNSEQIKKIIDVVNYNEVILFNLQSEVSTEKINREFNDFFNN